MHRGAQASKGAQASSLGAAVVSLPRSTTIAEPAADSGLSATPESPENLTQIIKLMVLENFLNYIDEGIN